MAIHNKDITYQLLLQEFSEEVHTWDELLAAAEIVEGVLNCADSSRHVDFWHERCSRSQRYDDVTERHKYHNIPWHRRDRSPVPVPQSANDEQRKQRGLPPRNQRRWDRSSRCPDRPRRSEKSKQTDNGRSSKHNPKSEKEHAQRAADGLCFKSGKPGHFSRNCPENNVVASSSWNNPPERMSSSRIGFDLSNVSRLSQMASDVPNQTTLELHSTMYGDCPEDGTYDGIDPSNDKMWLRTSTENSEGNPPAYVPEWGVPNDEVGIGDFLGNEATRILSGIHPDDCEDDNYGDFICQSLTDTHYVIILSQDLIAAAPPGKNWAEYKQDVLISTEVINRGLTGRFYANWCIKMFGVQEEDLL